MRLAVPYERSFVAVCGLELVAVDEGSAHARLPVAAHVRGLDGALHAEPGDHEWSWTVEARNATGLPCATSTVVIAIRQPFGGTPLAGAVV